MSGTAKTTPALLAEQADNTTQLILAQQMRNLTVSGPQWDVVSAASAPGILRGFVELGDYVARNGGTLGAGQVLATRQTNATQVQNAFNYAANNNKFLEFAPNTIEIDNTTGILVQAASFAGFRLYGDKETSILAQFHSGTPVMVLGPTDSTSIAHVIMDGIYLRYSGPLVTGFPVLQLGYIYFSAVGNVSLDGSQNADMCVYAGSPTNAGVDPFSNIFFNWTGYAVNANFIQCNAASTGNLWQNCYFQNNSLALSAAAVSFGAQSGAAPSETTFDGCNWEHCNPPNCMFWNGGSATFIGCHWEDIRLTGANPQFWRFANAVTNIQIIGGTTYDLILNSTLMSGTAVYFSFYDDAMVSMRGHKFQTSGTPPLARTQQLQMYSGPDNASAPPVGITRTMVKIDDTRFDAGYAGFMSLDTSMPRATYGDYELVDGYKGLNVFNRLGRVVVDNPPTALIVYGNLGPDVIVRYTNPLSGNLTLRLATLLVSGGTLNRPALDQVRVIREASATGAFTITVQNAAGTTIGSAFSTSSAGTSQVYIHTTTAGTWTQTI
jgi:hypothetical protein